MLRRDLLPAAILTLATRLAAGNPIYQSMIEKWRQEYDAGLRSDKGPLYLIGRCELPEGRSGIGSGAGSLIPLPARAPKRIGVFERSGGNVTFLAARGIRVQLNGKPLSGPVTLRTGLALDSRDRLQLGDFTLSVVSVGGLFQLGVRDLQSPYLKRFQGALWFPVNPAYRVEARFRHYPQPKQLKIPDTTSGIRSMSAPGYLIFRLNGENSWLEPVLVDGGDARELFIMFKDHTSYQETYGAGRFLEALMPVDGKVMLDFNKAYNPYCAVNPYSSCPIAQKENTLMTRVEAGEKYRGAR